MKAVVIHEFGGLDARKLNVKLSKTYMLEDVKKTQEQIESSHTQGKIVLRIG